MERKAKAWARDPTRAALSVNTKWALAVEGGYRHIPDADSSDRNRGLDSLGGQIGLVHSFGR